jgi:acetyltransferase-like isoleucine patch superfamily enzyme
MDFKRIILLLLRTRKPPKGTFIMGRHSTGTPYMYSDARSDYVIIGNFCSIGPDVIIIPGMGHIPLKEFQKYRVSSYPLHSLKNASFKQEYRLPVKGERNIPVIIGNDVWIGARAMILPEVTIGDGAVIGAGAIVSGDVEPYSLVAGVPAKIIRYRYQKEQIEKLLSIKWWNWSDEKIIENIDYFYGDIDKFLEKFYDR